MEDQLLYFLRRNKRVTNLLDSLAGQFAQLSPGSMKFAYSADLRAGATHPETSNKPVKLGNENRWSHPSHQHLQCL
jgi:hypothetical protein